LHHQLQPDPSPDRDGSLAHCPPDAGPKGESLPGVCIQRHIGRDAFAVVMAIARISPPPAPPPTLSPPVSRRQSTIPLVSPGIPSRLWLHQDCSIKTLAPYSGNSIKTLAPYFGVLRAVSRRSRWFPQEFHQNSGTVLPQRRVPRPRRRQGRQARRVRHHLPHSAHSPALHARHD
jgi:hypothetical protein